MIAISTEATQLAPLCPMRELLPKDVACVIAVKNEELRLPDILRHHRNLGISRFLIIDNGSSDGTVRYLLDQPDVDLWHTSQPYSDARLGAAWYDEITRTYGRNRWYLVIDADELFVYPGMESIKLVELCQILSRQGKVTLRAPMIDMYPKGNIGENVYSQGDSLIAHSPYFDGQGYRYKRTRNGGFVLTGGPRTRLLSADDGSFYHVLEKYPLRFLGDDEPINNVHIHPRADLTLRPTAALLHFKFLPDFKIKIDEALDSGQHWKESREYKVYNNHFSQLASPWFQGSEKYESPESLVKNRLIARPKITP